MMPSRRALAIICLALAVTAGTARGQRADSPTTIIAPAAPGGGWDQLARTMQRVFETEGILPRVQVENIPGAAGTVGLARFVSARRGDPHALLITGLVMVGGIVQNAAPVTLEQTTPIARLLGEFEVLVVPASSSVHTLSDLLKAFALAPASVVWGGGSAGGTDQMLVDLIAVSRGIDPRAANYVAFSGGGEATAALLGNQVTVGVSGLGEFAALMADGQVRALAISSPRRLPGVDVPTLRELGVPVDLANWRGVVAPPGMTPARRAAIVRDLERMVRSPSWKQDLVRRGWQDLWLPGEGFSRFLTAEAHRVETLVAARRGVRAVYSTAALAHLPQVLGVVLVALLVAIGIRQRTRSAPRTARITGVSFIALGMLVDVLLIDTVGFVLAGAALFGVTAAAFGERRFLRTAAGGLIFAAAVYVVFRMALDVPLPIGRLWGAP